MTKISIQKLFRDDLDDMVLEYCKLFGLPEKVVYSKQGWVIYEVWVQRYTCKHCGRLKK